MRPTEITLAIFEKYKPEELAATAQEMAAAQAEMETAESEKKMSDGVFNERIKGCAAKVSELAGRYNKGGETAQIGCTIRYDIPTVGKKSYIRMDTEEAVEVHDMSLDEKQETLQFPLSTQMADAATDPKPEETPATGESREEFERDRFGTAGPVKPAITFKDIQAVARQIVKLAIERRDTAIADMTRTIALQLLAQQTAIGPDGRLETIDNAELAEKLASSWLKFAVEEESKPPAAEETTRICPYPGCILFAEHEGDHDFPPVDAGPADAPKARSPAREAQPEKERKAKRVRRPPAEPPQPGAPA